MFQGLLLLHAGEEFVPILPIVLLLAAWRLMSWAGKGEAQDATADEDDNTPA